MKGSITSRKPGKRATSSAREGSLKSGGNRKPGATVQPTQLQSPRRSRARLEILPRARPTAAARRSSDLRRARFVRAGPRCRSCAAPNWRPGSDAKPRRCAPHGMPRNHQHAAGSRWQSRPTGSARRRVPEPMLPGARKVSRKKPPSGCGARPSLAITSLALSVLTQTRGSWRRPQRACSASLGHGSVAGISRSALQRIASASAREVEPSKCSQNQRRPGSAPTNARRAGHSFLRMLHKCPGPALS